MTEVAAKKAASASAMSVIATALLAWLAANKYSSDGQPPAVPAGNASQGRAKPGGSATAESKKPAPHEDALTLRPLRDALFGEASLRGKEDLQSLRTELEKASPKPALHCMLSTVPDPTASLGFRFDETIDSIEAAARAYGYVLERWHLPSSEPPEKVMPEGTTKAKSGRHEAAEAKAQPASDAAEPVAGDPGLLVFRRAQSASDSTVGATELLLVFLITETPTQGVDRLALTRALKLATALEAPENSGNGAARTINILAPCFSGSMPSLRDALHDYLLSINDSKTAAYDVEILSGTTSAFDNREFLNAFGPGKFKKLNSVSFASMTHRFERTLDVILEFLGRSRNDPDVAILSEIDTGFGESVSKIPGASPAKSGDTGGSISLQYPSQIAEIRRKYESQGLLKDGASNAFQSAAELRGRDDAVGNARDVFPNLAPDWTALSENRVLTQTLRYLEDSRLKVIGIIGTDPRDTIFLARLIKRYCPDARLFTVGSDLFYLDDQSIADLRGMIIGSTYPLYAPNHSWTGSDTRSRGQVFPSEGAQGVYNAAVVQIARLTDPLCAFNKTEQQKEKRWEREGEYLVEYSTPAPLRAGKKLDHGLPPVWVSVVGERSIYPVDCRLIEPTATNPKFDNLYLARVSRLGPPALMITRAVAWVVLLCTASVIILFSYFRRLHRTRAHPVSSVPRSIFRSAATSEMAVTLARILILAGYLYLACPAFAQLVPGTVLLNLVSQRWSGIFPWALVMIPLCVTLAAFLAAFFEFRSGHSSWRAVEAVGTVLVLIMVGFVQVGCAANPRWLLSLDRSTVITGGVSPYVSTAFLMAALGAWLYARRRIHAINETFAFNQIDKNNGSVEASADANRATLKRIHEHRARFDRWYVIPREFFRFIRFDPFFKVMWLPWGDVGPTLIAAAILLGTFADMVVFRPISLSDERWLFDLFFRLAFGLVLTLVALNFARLHSAWADFRVVLDGLARILGGAFERIPKNVSNWLIDTESCNAEYGQLIFREIRSAQKLLSNWDMAAEPPKTPVVLEKEQVLAHLSVLEVRVRDGQSPSADEAGKDVESFRYLARALSPYWADVAIDSGISFAKPAAEEERTEPSGEEKLIHHIENILALEAARWVGGALVRVWISIGFLTLSAVAMLFAITSYPFPEQSRVMTVIGFAIAALVFMILRVALGSSRNEVISKIDGTAPGRITWDSNLFSSVATYVVPLVGLLTAVSFDMLDLFRSVLGPILRLFP